tara:strand:+ start:2225 stop:4798 length:2574 start_codon:yes stop_codon:yes gene_type:complete
MKNKINLFTKAILIFFLINFFNYLSADDILIDAQEVNISDEGNVISANGSVKITDGKKIDITGNNAKYNKLNQTLEIFGDVIFFDKEKNYYIESSKVIFDREKKYLETFEDTKIKILDEQNIEANYELKGENSFFDQNKKILKIINNVSLKDLLNDYKVLSQEIVYFSADSIIKSKGDTKINYKDEFSIITKNIEFNEKKNSFFTKEKTTIKDTYKNKFILSNFNFNLNDKYFKGQKIELYDEENNLLKLSNGYLDLKTNELIGSDFNITFNKEIFGNSENDPRLFGRYIISNKSETVMKKSSFTTCKITDGKCPAWSISSNETIHKREKKRIEYKNAWLKIHDMPVAYFPYFFHPDPTVKRQSGFLFPQFINSTNLGFSTKIPYYHVISEDKDVTISPRVFSNNNLFIQSEYRQVFENSNLISDFSYNKKNNSNSHFFSKLDANYEDSFYQIKIQSVTNKDYLKKYQIKSPLIGNYSTLESLINYEKYSENYNFSTSFSVVEDLSKVDSDRYTYSFPDYSLTKEFLLDDNIFNQINFSSSGNYSKYNTNVDDVDIVNDLTLSSDNFFKFNNFNTNFDLLFKNINSYSDLEGSYNNSADYKLLNSSVLKAEYPMIKEYSEGKKYLTPIASFRYSPNKGINKENTETLVSFQKMFETQRVSGTVESGSALTLGFEHKNLNINNEENLNFGLAINLRNERDNDLPKSSSLGQTTSDLIGYSGINITENLTFNYNFSVDKDLSETNYSLVSANFTGKKLKTSFEYLEKSNFIGDESYLNNITELEINNSNKISFQTNKNLDKNLTNYYNLIYKYSNDCLEASIVYNKQFYDDDSVNSGKNIFFKISFIPFGSIITPGIND